MKVKMNKKKTIISLSFLSATAVLAGVIGVQAGTAANTNMNATDTAAWRHYSAVNAGLGRKGIKEYWTDCAGHTTITDPGVTATDFGAPDQNFINRLGKDDERLVKAHSKLIDFEDESTTYPFYDLSKSTNVKSVTVEDGVGVNGSKGLVIEASDVSKDRGLFFKKEFLDEIFADSSIKELKFEAKGEVASSNFRHQNSAKSNICYQQNQDGWGLTTQWQSFSFDRAMYEDIQATGGFVIWGTVGGKIYVDNIQPLTKDIKADTMRITMDELGKINRSGNDSVIYNAYSNALTDMKVWTSKTANEGVTVDYSTSVKSEGTRSLHVYKPADCEICLGVTNRLVDNCDPDGVTFDILTTVGVGPANFKKFQNRTSTSINGDYTLAANKWTTVTVPYNNIRDCGDGRDYVFQMTGTDGKKEMDIYIDNIRPAKRTTDTIIDFNDNGMFTYDTTYSEFTSKFVKGNDVNPINASNLRDTGKADFWINNPNGAGTIAFDYTTTKEGVGSLRFDITDGTKGFYLFFNKSVNTNFVAIGDSVVFDVYSECVGNITLGQANTAGRSSGTVCKPFEWTTVTLTKTESKADQFFRLHEGAAGSTGSFWIDNIRIVKAA